MLELNNKKAGKPVRQPPSDDAPQKPEFPHEASDEVASAIPPTRYLKDSPPPTDEQLKRREEAAQRVNQLRGQVFRDFDIGDAVASGAYEVP